MKSTQRELAGILLGRIHFLGLISDFTHSRAMDLVYSTIDFREFFQCPVCWTEEAEIRECAQDT